MRGLAFGLVVSLLAPLTFGRSPEAADPPLATIEFLDVGQGDAILVRSPEGKSALIDAGPSRDVVTLLKARGLTSLDLVVVSHHHADHYGGMEEVVKQFHPRVFLATDSSHTTPHYLKLLRAVRDAGIEAIRPTDVPRRIGLGSVTLTVFPQPPEDAKDENDNSIAIRLTYKTFSALLTGDSESGERTYWSRTVPDLAADCTVMKLAHHGSRNGVDAGWLSLVRPRLAVASLGRDNEFGHPHPETLALLREFEIPLARTDRDGTIRVTTDGRRWKGVRVHEVERAPPVDHEPRASGRMTKETKGRSEKRPGRVLDLNRSTPEELETLPGVGPVLARRIIDGRPYGSVEELRNVKNIGPKRLEEIRPYLTVR